MEGYKAFDKGLICKNKQYKENTIFEEEKAVLCECGMHFCEYPLNVWKYYPPVKDGELTEYAQVEALDEPKTDDKEKWCSKKLKIGAKIGIPGLVKASVDYIISKIEKENSDTNTGDRSASTNTGDRSASTNTGNRSASTNTGDRSASTNTGYRSASTNTGYRSASTNTGYRSASTNTGDCSASTVSGEDSVAIAFGVDSKAKGAKGCYIALAEWKWDDEKDRYILLYFKSRKVDGKRIKADTFYKLVDGKFVEAD